MVTRFDNAVPAPGGDGGRPGDQASGISYSAGPSEVAAAAFQAGVWVVARPEESLRDFMAASLGFPASYIEGSVSTVFLDASPVDDIDAAVVRPGCLVALSGAMPGLVGAVMRRKSPYASFRKAISHTGESVAEAAGDGGIKATGGHDGRAGAKGSCLVRLKLFNAVLRDMGRPVIERGAWIEYSRAVGFAAAGLGSRGESDPALEGCPSPASGLPGAPDLALVRLPA